MTFHQNCTSCLTICTSVIFWILALISYMLEQLFGIWSAILYFQNGQYAIFAVISVSIIVPTVILTFVSLIWYYDQDRLYRLLQEAHPNDQDLKRYKNLIRADSLLSHVILLGQIYRYVELNLILCYHSCFTFPKEFYHYHCFDFMTNC